jgi:hypothetical protein
MQPPIFSYGFYLPQTLLIFIICLVYSVLPGSELITIFGLIYFVMGSFIYKYQLLYAMDHRQHSSGKAWIMICERILVGMLFFQLAMAGQLIAQKAIKRGIMIAPLLIGTIWFMLFYTRTYGPLMTFIALRSLHDEDDESEPISLSESRYASETRHGRVVDESEETGLRFINPNLISPLEEVWVSKRKANGAYHGMHSSGSSIV